MYQEGLPGRDALLTQHQDFYVELQYLLVLGEDAGPGATVLDPHLGHGKNLAAFCNFTPWALPLHRGTLVKAALQGQGQ